MQTMMLFKSFFLINLLVGPASGQFTCTFSGSHNAADCTDMTDDDDEHCVWCKISSERHVNTQTVNDFGFCISEIQAEAMEKSIPSVHCERYSGDTDDHVEPTTDDGPVPIDDDGNIPADDVPVDTDDTTPPTTDDTTPPETDDTAPNNDDHSVPDDFWTCLQKKNEKTCSAASCTWCNTKGGFGLCMTGPTAESASHSDWFDCHNATIMSSFDNDMTNSVIHVPSVNVMNPCLTSYVSQRTANDCMTTKDTNGKYCEWCTILDMSSICLTSDQAALARPLGVSCESDEELHASMEDPYDPSCLLAYLEDSSESTCIATVDADGNACEYCSLQDQINMCLTSEQASMGEQFGITCNTNIVKKTIQDDPYDPSCLLAYIQNSSKDACLAAVDEDNNPCEFCSLQGSVDLCLTTEQAAMGEQLGITCDEMQVRATIKDDPYDPSCLLAYLQDSSKDACLAAVDEDNIPCEFCSLQGSLDLCLTTEQAAMGEQLGITCDEMQVRATIKDDPYDPSCLLAYLQDSSKDACLAAVDEDNNPCEFCSLQGSLDLCLTTEQAAMGEQLGITCDESKLLIVELQQERDPYDQTCMTAFWTDQSKDECIATTDGAGKKCQYCSLPGSFVMCLNYDQAEIGKALGMECDSMIQSDQQNAVSDPYDMSCAKAYLQTPSKDACLVSLDANGVKCEFCSLQEGSIFSMCLTSEQAELGKQMGMDCATTSTNVNVEFPDDFFDCLQHYEDDDCRSSSCTWCNTEVGLGFCLSPTAAETTKECTFFDCEFDEPNAKKWNDIYDPICLSAGMPTDENFDASINCESTNGTNGQPCVWCDAAGVFGLCFSSDQAAAAGQYLKCDSGAVSVSI